jgi:hypothetical protein
MWAKSLLLSAFVAMGSVSGPVSANPRVPPVFEAQTLIPTQSRDDDRQRDIRPLREVVDILRGRYGGELISARLEGGQRPIYVIRWRMPDGEVRDFRVDAVR